MNYIKINNKIFKFEFYFRKSKEIKEYDYYDKIIPYPKESMPWSLKNQFLKYILGIQHHLKLNNKFAKYNKKERCLLCDREIITGIYTFKNIKWNDGFVHYMDYHNIKPSDEFIHFIYNLKMGAKYKEKYTDNIYTSNTLRYVKITRNQLNILDALMKYGGTSKKYIYKNSYLYSEHTGVLDFRKKNLYRIIVAGNTNIVDEEDKEIFLPNFVEDMKNYEYIFHTHPPTPKPGSRAHECGILYEFHSISDIFFFIDNHNKGNVIGSLVVAPEGLYNLRKLNLNHKKIKIDENKLFKQFNKLFIVIQELALKKYENFTIDIFYTQISHDLEFIGKLNKLLNEFELMIDYFPRKKDTNDRWIMDTIYLPFY